MCDSILDVVTCDIKVAYQVVTNEQSGLCGNYLQKLK